MSNKNNIERLFEEQFQDYKPDPSVETWSKINRQLKWKNFMRPRWDSFNVAYLSVIVISTIITALVLNKNLDDTSSLENESLKYEIKSIEDVSEKDIELQNKNDQADNIQSSIENSALKSDAGIEKSTEDHVNKAALIDKNSNKEKNIANVEVETSKISSGTLPQTISGAQLPPRAYYLPSCDEGCAPLKISFANISTEAEDYIWSFGDGGQSAEINPVYIYDEPGKYFVTLTAKNKNNEISVYQNVITVYGVPEASFMIEKQESTIENVSVYFYNYSQGAVNYTWDFGDGNKSTDKNPTHIFDSLAQYDILLEATSEKGCIDTTILSNALIREDPIIKIPNVFSPNKNGPNGGYYSRGISNNEIFHPFIENTPVEYQLRIFNRNGNLLFESKDINIGWDGYYMQQLQPRGVYIYKLKLKFENGEYIVKMGDITVYIQD